MIGFHSLREAASNFLNKIYNSTCTFLFQNLSALICWTSGLLNLARTSKEYTNTILGYFSISQSNHYSIMVSKCTDECFIRPSAKLWLGQCVHLLFNRAIIGQYPVSPSPFSLSHTYLRSPHNALHLLLVFIYTYNYQMRACLAHSL